MFIGSFSAGAPVLCGDHSPANWIIDSRRSASVRISSKPSGGSPTPSHASLSCFVTAFAQNVSQFRCASASSASSLRGNHSGTVGCSALGGCATGGGILFL